MCVFTYVSVLSVFSVICLCETAIRTQCFKPHLSWLCQFCRFPGLSWEFLQILLGVPDVAAFLLVTWLDGLASVLREASWEVLSSELIGLLTWQLRTLQGRRWRCVLLVFWTTRPGSGLAPLSAKFSQLIQPQVLRVSAEATWTA